VTLGGELPTFQALAVVRPRLQAPCQWAKISAQSGDAVIQNGMEQSMHAMGMLQKAAGK
jgi:hypothetical protein